MPLPQNHTAAPVTPGVPVSRRAVGRQNRRNKHGDEGGLLVTLVLTELSPLGIAMAAESAVTFEDRRTGILHVEPDAARKLHKVTSLKAGVSCWGMGSIAGTPTDQWLEEFIAENSGLSDLSSFAQELASRLRSALGPAPGDTARLGFHVAGFEQYEGNLVPSFFHVHDGPSTTLMERGDSVDPTRFNANHDMPPSEFLKRAAHGGGWITRNGDYQLYGRIFGLLESLFRELMGIGIHIPLSQDLRDRAEYLVFQIRTVAELYRMSNLVPGIGGPIRFLTISATGIQSEGVSYH